MFASVVFHRSRYGAEWNDRVAEADDETIAETFAPDPSIAVPAGPIAGVGSRDPTAANSSWRLGT
jgi:hypothetical protein